MTEAAAPPITPSGGDQRVFILLPDHTPVSRPAINQWLRQALYHMPRDRTVITVGAGRRYTDCVHAAANFLGFKIEVLKGSDKDNANDATHVVVQRGRSRGHQEQIAIANHADSHPAVCYLPEKEDAKRRQNFPKGPGMDMR